MVDPNRKINILTEEQQNFLDECESEFDNRFTDEDKVFMDEYVNVTPRDPPIVEPWYNKPRRNFDHGSRRGRGNYGNQRYNNHRGGNRYNYDYNHDNRRNYRGGGGKWNNRGRGGNRDNRGSGRNYAPY